MVGSNQTQINNSKRPLSVFLCHSSADRATVGNLYQRLQRDGIAPWLDNNVLPGQHSELEIRKAVQTSDVVIVCISSDFMNNPGSGWQQMRIALEEANKKPQGTIFLIPLKLDECDIPQQLEHLKSINLFEEGAYGDLMKALRLRSEKITQGNTSLSEPIPNPPPLHVPKPLPNPPSPYIPTSPDLPTLVKDPRGPYVDRPVPQKVINFKKTQKHGGDRKKSSPKKENLAKSPRKKPLAVVSQVSFTVVFPVVFCIIGGDYLDGVFHSDHFLLLSGALLGLLLGAYGAYRLFSLSLR